MTRMSILLSAAGAALVVSLSACGGGGTVTFGPEGATASASGAGVSVGADGVRASDGNGNAVTAGPDRISVTAGPTGGTVDAGSGDRQGTFGTSGQVTLTGAVAFQGRLDGTCDVNGDQRTITVITPDGYTVVIDTNGAPQATLTVQGSGGFWKADYNGDGDSVVTMTARRTAVRAARLAGSAGVVTLEASFDC
jgi:hypothetical protein